MKTLIAQAGLLMCLASGALLALTVQAQATMNHGKMVMSKLPSMTDGEIRKVDLANGKVTLKHGDIKHMDMPGMTMVFTAKDKALLTGLKVGDKVRFMAESINGQMWVTGIEAGK